MNLDKNVNIIEKKGLDKKVKRKFNLSLVISIIFVIVGLFLFIKPDTTVSIISYVIGGTLISAGVFSAYKYFSSNDILSIFNFDLVYGVLMLIAGVFLIIKPFALSSFFPVILGIWIIINSVMKFQYALVLRKINNNDWAYTCLISFLTFLWGVVLLFNPLKTALAITQIIGIFIIVYAILDIIDNFIIRKNIDDILKIFE